MTDNDWASSEYPAAFSLRRFPYPNLKRVPHQDEYVVEAIDVKVVNSTEVTAVVTVRVGNSVGYRIELLEEGDIYALQLPKEALAFPLDLQDMMFDVCAAGWFAYKFTTSFQEVSE